MVKKVYTVQQLKENIELDNKELARLNLANAYLETLLVEGNPVADDCKLFFPNGVKVEMDKNNVMKKLVEDKIKFWEKYKKDNKIK